MMAPVADSLYFPSLDKCLKGDHHLLSWRLAYDVLCGSTNAAQLDGAQKSLLQFFSEEDALNAIAQPFSPFGSPTPTSKSAFETKTAPINATPSGNGQYDIEQIKRDTIWLSSKAKIDELGSLRIVIIEWQSRRSGELAVGESKANGATTQKPDPTRLESERRARQVSLYLSERLSILQISELLLRAWSARSLQDYPPWMLQTGEKLALAMAKPRPPVTAGGTSVKTIIDTLRTKVKQFDERKEWPFGDDNVEDGWGAFVPVLFAEIVHTLHLLFTQVTFEADLLSSLDVANWFKFCMDVSFFSNSNEVDNLDEQLFLRLQLLISTISLSILNLSQSLDSLSSTFSNESNPDETRYLYDPMCVGELQEILTNAADRGMNNATPAIFAWSLIAQKIRVQADAYRGERDEAIDQEDFDNSHRSSTGAAYPMSIFEKLYDRIRDFSGEEDSISKLAFWSVGDGKIFDFIVFSTGLAREEFGTTINTSTELCIRLAFWDLIKQAIPNVVYNGEIVGSILAVMNRKDPYWDLIDDDRTLKLSVVDLFASDRDVFLPYVLSQARQRYPHETAPLLELSRTLCRCKNSDGDGLPHIIQFLHFMNSFTQTMPPHFVSYELREESTMNGVKLTSPLALFSLHWNRKQTQSRGNELAHTGLLDVDEDWLIPEATNGDILNDEKPFVACWEYEHSPLEYLATLLSTIVLSCGRVEFASQQSADLEKASEIISLFAALLTSCVKHSEADSSQERAESAQKLLEEINKEPAPNQDLISIVFGIFEQELERKGPGSGADASTSLLVSCVQFLHALIPIQPSRVWSFLSRSQLLQVEQSNGNLAAIVVTNEIVTGRFTFLSACIRLFAALIEDVIASSVVKKGLSKAVTRFESQLSAAFVSDKIINSVVTAFTHILVGVSENSPFWRFQDQEESLQIRCMLVNVFSRIIITVFGYDDQTNPASKLTAALSSAADYIAEVFLATSESSGPVNLILHMLESGVNGGLNLTYSKRSEDTIRQTQLALSFSTTVLKLGILLDRPNSYLESKLFKSTTGLVSLFLTSTTCRHEIVLLLKSLVESAGRVEGEPRSLLGHLGPDSAKAFLSALTTLDKPLCDPTIESDIWGLLSAIVSHRQQWVSIYLLTGSTPKDSLKNGSKDEKKKSNSKPLLAAALDKLSRLVTLPPVTRVAALKFISSSLNHWPWTINDLRKHPTFINGVADYVSNIQWEDNCPYAKQEQKTSEYETIAIVLEILAVYLHESRQLGDYSRAKDLFVKLSMLRQYGVSAPLYNSSLHANLRQNIEKKFGGCSVQNFKRTLLISAGFGKDYFYDIRFAENILKFHQSWNRSQGFLEEFVRANINLSFVESQILLLRSWKILAAEISNYCQGDKQWLGALVKTATDCLEVNARTNGGENLFNNLKFTRTDLAFVLVQKLVSAKYRDENTKGLYSVVWNTILESGQDFDIAFGDDNAEYYRALLKILFLSIQFCVIELENKTNGDHSLQNVEARALKNPPQVVLCLNEILVRLVGKGFRSLATQLHEDQSKCRPSDFALITALLQSIIRVPGMDLYHPKLSLELAGNGLARCATSLFSWSDQLAIDRDPIYGELSILFLLELSNIGSMAETLAVEGVLSQLSSANLVNYYRRPNGMGPFDEPQRVYHIWARGFLPLCLNLLDAVGAPVAAEVASFLNQFSNQLSRSSDGFGSNRAYPSAAARNSGRITLSMAAETHSLAIIWLVLERFRQQGPGLTGLATEIPDLAWDHAGVKEDVDSWLKSSGALRDSIVPTNEREFDLARAKPVSGSRRAQSRLEEQVIQELEGALMCLETPPV